MKIVAHEDQLREQWRTGVETRMHVSARNGAAQLCIFEQWVAPTAGAPTHSHAVEEVLTIVSGEASVWVDGRSEVLSRGQSLIIPAGQTHGFRNIGSTTLHVHAVLASSIFEAMFEGVAEPVQRWFPTPADAH